ncbi:MAG: hypothetical protein V1722_00385 [Candidatus Micrarchaeota archaeon]
MAEKATPLEEYFGSMSRHGWLPGPLKKAIFRDLAGRPGTAKTLREIGNHFVTISDVQRAQPTITRATQMLATHGAQKALQHLLTETKKLAATIPSPLPTAASTVNATATRAAAAKIPRPSESPTEPTTARIPRPGNNPPESKSLVGGVSVVELEKIKPVRREIPITTVAYQVVPFGQEPWFLHETEAPKPKLLHQAQPYAHALYLRDTRPEAQATLEQYLPAPLLDEIKTAYARGLLDRKLHEPGDEYHENVFHEIADYLDYGSHNSNTSNHKPQWTALLHAVLQRVDRQRSTRHKVDYLLSALNRTAATANLENPFELGLIEALTKAHEKELGVRGKHISSYDLRYLLYDEGYAVAPRSEAASISIKHPLNTKTNRITAAQLQTHLDPVHFSIQRNGRNEVSIHANTMEGVAFIDRMELLRGKSLSLRRRVARLGKMASLKFGK